MVVRSDAIERRLERRKQAVIKSVVTVALKIQDLNRPIPKHQKYNKYEIFVFVF